MKSFFTPTKILFLFFLLMSSLGARAQKRFSTYIGLSVGGKLEDQFPCEKPDHRPRMGLFISQYFKASPRFCLGLEAMTSGPVFTYLYYGDGGTCTLYDQTTNTTTYSFNNLNTTHLTVRAQFQFLSSDQKIQPHIGIGFGNAQYKFNSLDESRNNFIISPEIGARIGKVRMATYMFLGGKTPSFLKFDDLSNNNVKMNSIDSNLVYVSFSYRLVEF